MRLASSIVVRKAPEEVWTFLEDITNLPKWDRGVASVRWTSLVSRGIGSEFDTLAYPRRPDRPEWGRMSYRVTEWDAAARFAVVQLISTTGNARFFRTLAWLTRVEPAPEGSRVDCSVYFRLSRSLRVPGAGAVRKQTRPADRSRVTQTGLGEFVRENCLLLPGSAAAVFLVLLAFFQDLVEFDLLVRV